MKNYLLLIGIGLVLSSCNGGPFKEGKVFAGGKYVEASTLNKGSQIYKEYCMACHGVDGDGKGVASKGLNPPPRNFKIGIIKFGDVVSGELPHDESIYKTLKHGLNGTAMLPWDLSQGQMEAVWQYIKTFAPDVWEGKDKKLGEKLTMSKDPYGLAHKQAAILKGKEVYHITANCQSCHRGYIPESEYRILGKKVDGEDPGEVDEDYYKIKPQESEHDYLTIPPDFTWHHIRSAKTVDEIYFRLLAGVGGSAMPSWKGTIEDNEIWAVSHYVKYLMDMRRTKERKNFIERISK